MGIEAVGIVVDRINKHRIACDLKMGYFEGGYHLRHQKVLEKEYEQWLRLGYGGNLQWIEKDNIASILHPLLALSDIHGVCSIRKADTCTR